MDLISVKEYPSIYELKQLALDALDITVRFNQMVASA
jgi:hypothetical protein